MDRRRDRGRRRCDDRRADPRLDAHAAARAVRRPAQERARAADGRLPDEVGDDQAILISDIFPTGCQAADLAEIREGDVVCVLGCGNDAIEAYEQFDARNAGWLKVALDRAPVSA